jgi:hypothetical protein
MSLRVAKKKSPEPAIKAVTDEIKQLINRGTMIPVKCAPQNERILPSILNMTEKFGPNGEFIKMKSGNHVDRSTYNHFEEVTSRTMNYESLMTLLSAGAYHNAILGTLVSGCLPECEIEEESLYDLLQRLLTF